MRASTEREKVRFRSGDDDCVAWHYPGGNGACVVMAGGFAVPKEPATDLFARRFAEAGFSVLAFDYRRLGESGGAPRLVLPVGDQIADWDAALAFAATLPGVDPTRVGAWGFSAAGGLLFRVAARNRQLSAVVVQTPNMGGPSALRNAAGHQKASAMLRLTGRGIGDALGGIVGRAPRLVPLVGERGTVAMLATPDAFDGARALTADRHPEWQQAVAARSVLGLSTFRAGGYARRVRCPLLVVVCDDDRTSVPEPAVRAAARAPYGELLRVPGGHYAPFLSQHERVADAELGFLRRALVDRVDAPSVAG